MHETKRAAAHLAVMLALPADRVEKSIVLLGQIVGSCMRLPDDCDEEALKRFAMAYPDAVQLRAMTAAYRAGIPRERARDFALALWKNIFSARAGLINAVTKELAEVRGGVRDSMGPNAYGPLESNLLDARGLH